jgi:WD40 repeat protein
MTVASLESECFVDLPNHFCGFLDLKLPSKKMITSFCLSPHGFLFGIGTLDGFVYSRDSLTCSNQREYTQHRCEVSSVSFSRDTQKISSGDKSGLLKIHSVDDCKLEFEYQFTIPINSVEYSPKAGNQLLILFEDSTVKIVDNSHCLISCLGTFSCVQWCHLTSTFFAASEKKVTEFSFPSLEIIQNWTFEEKKMKSIVSLTLSLNDRFVLVLDRSGTGRCFSLVARTVISHYSDRVNRVRFTVVAFDRSTEHVILSSKSVMPEMLRVYTVQPGNQVKTFGGPHEVILQLISHPRDSLFYARCKSGIITWKSSTRFRMRNSVPQPGLMRANSMFYEPEDCFDGRVDSFEMKTRKGKKLPKVILSLDLLEPVDISFFQDDKDYPNQLLILPWRPIIKPA